MEITNLHVSLVSVPFWAKMIKDSQAQANQ